MSTFARVGGLTLAAAAIVAVPTLSLKSMTNVEPGDLPYKGFPVAEEISSLLPDGGTILVLSETCGTCQDRARAFIRAVERDSTRILLIGTTDQPSRFRDLVDASNNLDGRAVFVTPQRVLDLTLVQIVPAYVSINEEGRVVKTGGSTIGWLGATINPSRWFDSWADLVRRE